jgi:two-component system, OmpR family, response regulator
VNVAEEEIIRVGDDALYPERMELRLAGGRTVAVTRQQLVILRALMSKSGRIVTRPQLLSAATDGVCNEGQARNIDVQIGRLRKRMGDAGWRIEARRQLGYRWLSDEAQAQAA